MKFDVTATISFDIQAEVEADDYKEAEEMIESAIWDCNVSEEGICCTESNQDTVVVENVNNLNEDKWNGMSASAKVSFLEQQGVDGKEACEWVANEDLFCRDIEDYWDKLEVD